MRKLLTLILIFSSSSTFAVDYYWATSSSGTHYPDPTSACVAYLAALTASSNTIDYTFASLNWTSASTAACRDTFKNRSSGTTQSGSHGTATRYGTACPTGATYNSATGACDAPQQTRCQLLAGTRKTINVPTASDGSCPNKSSMAECEVLLVGVGISRVKADGTGSCRATVEITGKDLTATPQTTECTTDCADKDPKPETKNEPCTYTNNADGTVSCTSTEKVSVPGTISCESVGGTYSCTENPKATSSNTTTKTTNQTTTNPDGSTDTTTTTDKTKVVCSGVNSCSTSTSTTVVTGGTNANGSSKPTGSSCVGALCTGSDGKPIGSGTGTGSGEGEEEGDDDQSSVAGEACAAAISCTGDAIQCAILRQQKLQQCADAEWRDYSKAKPEIDAELAKPEYQLAEAEVSVNSMFNDGLSDSRFLTASCPSPRSFYIGLAGRSYTWSYQPICDYATAISYIIIALASIFYAVYVGRAFGGE